GFSDGLLERGEGPICFVGALDRRLNVQQVRLAGCRRAPPRSWTLLIALAGFLRRVPRAMTTAHLLRWRPRQPAQVGRAEAGGEASESGNPGERERATASTPRRLPSGAASQLDPSHRSSRVSPKRS